MQIHNPKQILIAPLDWGLGHTSRCIPIIRHIQSLGHNPIVGCNKWQQSFLRESLGEIDFVHLSGYNISYSRWNRLLQAGLLLQTPSIMRAINYEHEWLQQLVKERHIDAVISDNRYGLFHRGIPSVMLTHQLLVRSGLGKAADTTLQKLHYRLLERFDNIWVVDTPGIPNLGGELSHCSRLPAGAKYIGLLSRFDSAGSKQETDGSVLVLLSGPEPQRNELSAQLWQQAVTYKGSLIFVEGKEDAARPAGNPAHISWYSRLTEQGLAPILEKAAIIICRSGYSTIMDLIALEKKAILIPTPGQTEQQYLARYLNEQGMYYTAAQAGFELSKALQQAAQFTYKAHNLNGIFSLYRIVIKDWCEAL